MTRARNSANLASDGNLFVDIANDRTGIGSVAPAQNLHVAGTAGFHADTTFTGDLYNTTWDRSDNSLKFVDNAKAQFGTGNDLTIRHTGSASYIENSTGFLFIHGNDIALRSQAQENYIICDANAEVQIFYDGSKKLETTAYGINVTGTTDTDGLIVSGVATVTTMNVTGVLTYDDVTSIDSIGIITARSNIDCNGNLDVAGTSNFTDSVTFSEPLTLSKDANVVMDFSANSTSDARGIYFNSRAALTADYNDGFLRLNNQSQFSNGVYTPGLMRADGGFKTDGNVVVNSSGFIVASRIAGALPAIDGSNLTGIDTDLVSDTSPQLGGNLDVNTKNIVFGDSGGTTDDRLTFGAGTDLSIFHDGTHSYIDNNTGNLIIKADGQGLKLLSEGNIILRDNDDSTNMIRCINGGQVELHHAGAKKFETTSNGVHLSGTTNTVNGNFYPINDTVGQLGLSNRRWETINGVFLNINGGDAEFRGTTPGTTDMTWDQSDNSLKFDDSVKAKFGNSGDMEIYHDGTDNYIRSNNGAIILRDDTIHLKAYSTTDTYISCVNGGAVSLRYDNDLKAETYDNGLIVHHHLKVMGAQDQNAVIQMFADEGDNTNDQFLMASEHNPNRWVLLGQYVSGWHRYIQILPQQGVQLYYDDLDSSSPSAKLATTSAGIDVTGTITMDAVPGTNTNAALPVLFQTSAGVIDGGSQLTYNPGGDVLVVNGLTLSGTQVRTSGNNALQLTTANANGTVDLIVRTTHVECNGNFLPQTNNTDNLGSTSKRWANVYTNDLNLSNEGSSNDVDGTWGSYTIQEGEDDLFLINKRSGKKYKFNLTEVS